MRMTLVGPRPYVLQKILIPLSFSAASGAALCSLPPTTSQYGIAFTIFIFLKMIFNFQLDERLIQGGTLAFGLFFVLVGVFQILTKKIIYIKFRGVGCSNRGRSTMASCHVGWSAGVTLARSFGQSQISYSHKHNFHIFNNFLTCMYKCT